jgi:DNA-binding NtrC family response regulator
MKSKSRILIIDDEPDMLSGCAKIISLLGNDPVPVSDVEVAIKCLENEEFDLIFCDLLMPDHDGMEVLELCQKLAPNTPVIIFSAYGTIDRAVAAMKAGAFDFIEKPFDSSNLKILIEKGLRQRNLFRERINLLKQLDDKYHFDNIIGKSLVMRNVFDMIENVSNSDVNIMITGESGTGKELIARSIHARSRRKTKPFVPVNCGAFPENLFEAELFGYEKGAFTGAVHRKVGLIEFADGGTFFLDEVCELPGNLQIKLLRTLQDQKLRRVGGNDLIQVNVRLISATNQNIELALSQETLRKDFYYRLNVINIQVPPLRERKEDIQLLAEHFLDKCIKSSPKEINGFTNEVVQILEDHSWPGNVRELENVIERAVTLAKDNKITLADLPPHLINSQVSETSFDGTSLTELKHKAIEEIEKKFLVFLMQKYKGNITKIATDAGLTRRHIHRMINNYNIDPNNWRDKDEKN